MMVRVYRNFYGTGKLVNPSDLSLGPQRCKPDSQSTEMVVFQVKLQDCGNAVQMTQDWVIYTTNLTYSPTSLIPIIRTNPAVVPIICYYYRHANVSREPIKPTWLPFSTTVSLEERLSFSLRLMAEDWSGPRSSPIFELGQILYIEASVDTRNHMNLILYVDRCVATISPDMTSAPSYDIITDNGCLVDGVQDDSSSTFIAPRISSDKLQFTVDAFRFLGADVSLIYITCFLRAAAATQVPDSRNKACSYNKVTKSWFAVEGPSPVCQCCERLTCLPTAVIPPMSAGGRSRFGRPRSFGKREALDEPNLEGQTVTTLGPLLVTGPKQRLVTLSVKKEESAPVELWQIVGYFWYGVQTMAKRNQTLLTEFLLLGFGDLQDFKIVVFTIFLIIHVMALASNVLVTLVVFIRSLHSPMYILIGQLSLSEIIFTSNIVPNMLWLILVGGGKVSIARCIFQFFLLAFPTVAQSLLLASMSFDRYVAICKPLHYASIMTFGQQVQIVTCCWLLGFTVAFILYVLLDSLQFCGPDSVNHFYCDISPVVELSCSENPSVELVTSVLCFPFIVCPLMLIMAT
ncbi:PREDICTED: zona pellucida sperm-binding protein 3-like [Nanorana parkeri]|uniref:zona pellucida sperm-binding protein 3-like n=1 Tax=Nanorana parkeri TaxID=125878 RepID=UPI000854B932|nr:PREDICTED: zona pellucida sperm-binding protein 3-like [Nanorana parkeri]